MREKYGIFSAAGPAARGVVSGAAFLSLAPSTERLDDSSVIFLASPNSIMVLSAKNSSLSTPA